MKKIPLFLRWALLVLAASSFPAHAKLRFLDPKVQARQLALAEECYARQDVDGLMAMLATEHLFIKTEAALKLGRLGAAQALPLLRELDRQYANFACAESGQFGVAVILIENKNPEARKKALLDAATEPREALRHAYSVVDLAGRELSRFDGDDIPKALAGINTYGAQRTVLYFQCRPLLKTEAIAKCIAVLQSHETPQKAEAAQELLIGFGSEAKAPVEKLKTQSEGTVQNRCSRILEEIERAEGRSG